jgi:cell division septation protein DedD
MFRSGPTVGSVASVALTIIALPVLVSKLGAKAERDRDHDHPSR